MRWLSIIRSWFGRKHRVEEPAVIDTQPVRREPTLELEAVGYWSDHLDSPTLIHPARLISPAWEAEDRERIVSYLRGGMEHMSCLGYATCRFPDGPSGPEMGASDLTDGFWLWPQGLWVYVLRYHVRLPDEFVAHMRTMNFDPSPPEEKLAAAGYMARLDDPRLAGRTIPSMEVVRSHRFWNAWTDQERRRAEHEEGLLITDSAHADSTWSNVAQP